MTTARQYGSLKDYLILGAILFIVVLIWGIGWWWIDRYVLPVSVTDTAVATRGQFGDKFGAVNALFSGLAFAGIIFTILLQRSDLIETRKAISHERFDTTLFELLGLHMKITQGVEATGARGKDAFVVFHGVLRGKDSEFSVFSSLSKLDNVQIRQIIDTRKVDIATFPMLTVADVNNIEETLNVGVRALGNFLDTDLKMHEKKIVDAYTAAAELYIDDCAHYFRNLYNILKFIDRSEQISAIEKKRYSAFVRSQLSEAELIVLFYNSIAKIELPGREELELGYPKMSALLVKYDILQNMNPRSMFHPLHRAIFDKNNPKETK